MTGSWIDQVLSGTMHIPLPSLTLTKGSGASFPGSGRLEWERGEPIHLHAQTGGAAALLAEFGQPGAAPGELLHASQYITLAGECSDGLRVSASAVPMGGYDHFVGSPHATWDLRLRDVHLQGDGFARGREIRALLSPCLQHWPRATETTTDNAHFGGKSASRDWLEVDTCSGVVAVRARERGHGEVLVSVVDESCPQDAERLLTAIAAAFGFVMGRQVSTIAYEERTPERFTRALWARPREGGRQALRAPIGDSVQQMQHIEPLLGLAINYFLTEPGTRVVDHLYLCWDTADRAFPTQQLVACVSLEGLMRLARSRAAGAGSAPDAHDIAKIEEWLQRNPEGLTERTVARMQGMLGSLKHGRPDDAFRDWCDRGILGVTQKDMEAWKRARNASAHARYIGPLPSRGKLQRRVTDLVRIQNLMNRIVLQLVGYRGPYIDYASRDWGVAEFPAASPDDL